MSRCNIKVMGQIEKNEKSVYASVDSVLSDWTSKMSSENAMKLEQLKEFKRKSDKELDEKAARIEKAKTTIVHLCNGGASLTQAAKMSPCDKEKLLEIVSVCSDIATNAFIKQDAEQEEYDHEKLAVEHLMIWMRMFEILVHLDEKIQNEYFKTEESRRKAVIRDIRRMFIDITKIQFPKHPAFTVDGVDVKVIYENAMTCQKVANDTAAFLKRYC